MFFLCFTKFQVQKQYQGKFISYMYDKEGDEDTRIEGGFKNFKTPERGALKKLLDYEESL